MPELPEVEVVRAGLEAHVVGRIITDVEVMHPRPLRRHLAGPEHFAAAVLGHTVLAARRRGKYLWLPLENGDAILAHLGMSGQMLLQRAGAPAERHLRVRFTLSPRAGEAGPPDPDAVELRFVDQRMFGGIALSPGGAALPPEIAHIARDPMDPEFDDARFVAQVRRRTSGVKRLLLDQSLVSGVGNIYADEALWLAGLHGERRGDRLRRADVVAVLAGARTVMAAALAQGGTSFDALYVNVKGESGYFDRSLEVYGREGEPCTRCGGPIVRVPFMNRSSYFCPRCQPPPRARSRSAPTGTGAGSRRGRSGTTRTENSVLPVTSTTRPEREDPGIDPGGAECDSGNTLSIFPRPQPVPRCDPTSSFGGHIWPRRFSDT